MAGLLVRALSVWEVLRERAGDAPNSVAFLGDGGPALTYSGLVQQIEDAVRALRRFGLRRDARVAVALPADCTFPVAVVSVMCGSVCVPLNPQSTAAEFETLFCETRAEAILTSDIFPNAREGARRAGIGTIMLHPLNELGAGRFELHTDAPGWPVEETFPDPADLAILFATSGSTAKPKVVPLTHRGICDRAWITIPRLGLTPQDRCLTLTQSYHGLTIATSILGCLFAGAGNVFPGAIGVADFARCVDEYVPTWVAAPPPFVEHLLSEEYAWDVDAHPRLRLFFVGGRPATVEFVTGVERKFGAVMANGYGCTECGGMTSNPMPPGLRKLDSVGKPAGPEVAILDESGDPVETGVSGEIAGRGMGVFRGYDTAAGLDTSSFAGDWHRTGDRGYLDSDGYLYVRGRIREIINRGGTKISPEEVEAVLRLHPQVREAVAFAIPHETLGHEVAALVTGRVPEVDTAAVREFAAATLSRFKVPRVILHVREIPINEMGKIQRHRLADTFAAELKEVERSGVNEYAPPRTPAEGLIASVWAELLKVERAGLHDRFSDLGGDSILAVTMLSELNRKLGCQIPVTELWRSPTVARLAALVEGHATAGRSPLLFPLQTSGGLPPLFSVLPGWFPEVEHLSRCLGERQPVYALIPDPRPGGPQHGRSGREIVDECVAAMRSAQPHGPYFVLGRSIGGVVALEIALQLRREGEPIAFVGMIDTHYPGLATNRTLPKPLRLMEQLMGELVALPREQWRTHLMRLPLRAFKRRFRVRKGPTDALRAAVATNTRLEVAFKEVPRRYEGHITFFAAEESMHRGFLDRRIYWSRAASEGVEWHLLPGTHNLMCQEPLLGGFAEVLQRCLARARAAINDKATAEMSSV